MYEMPTTKWPQKSCCNKPLMCVKCGGSHNSKECKKSKETPAKCTYAEAIILPTTKVVNFITT
jgi:hypothetical protein